jgi:hypothetical protein
MKLNVDMIIREKLVTGEISRLVGCRTLKNVFDSCARQKYIILNLTILFHRSTPEFLRL